MNSDVEEDAGWGSVALLAVRGDRVVDTCDGG